VRSNASRCAALRALTCAVSLYAIRVRHDRNPDSSLSRIESRFRSSGKGAIGAPYPRRGAAEPPRGITPPGPPGRGSLESSKERRDRVCPSRTVFGQGWPNAEPTGMYSWRVLDGHTLSRCGLSGGRSLWNPAGWLKPPFRGQGPLPQARSHKGQPSATPTRGRPSPPPGPATAPAPTARPGTRAPPGPGRGGRPPPTGTPADTGPPAADRPPPR